MAGPSVSLLMPNRDNERTLGVVLDRLAATTTYPDVELIVVDDGSTDGSRDMLRRWRDARAFPGEVTLVEQENAGAIAALNTALEAAGGEVCVQLDADASVETQGWIERMLALLLCDARVGVVSAKVVMDSGELHACGVNVVHPLGLHDRTTVPLEPAGRRRWHHRVERRAEGDGGAEERDAAEVDSGIGCCMMYRREDALAAGGYDRAYSPVWFDDIDLCVSIRRLGRKVFYLPDVRVVHHLGARGGPVGLDRVRPSRFARAAVRRSAARLSLETRRRIEQRFDVDLSLHHSVTQRRRLDHHYAYWQEKWGWHPCNPDMDAIARRWGGTEVDWARDAEARAAGEAILAAHRTGAATDAA